MPAGTYHVICDAIIVRAVDVKFDLIWRRGDQDSILGSWMQHFDPLGGGSFKAQPYEHDLDAQRIEFEPGDLFIFRYAGMGAMSSEAFIPNGDGERADGRIPNITIPH